MKYKSLNYICSNILFFKIIHCLVCFYNTHQNIEKFTDLLWNIFNYQTTLYNTLGVLAAIACRCHIREQQVHLENSPTSYSCLTTFNPPPPLKSLVRNQRRPVPHWAPGAPRAFADVIFVLSDPKKHPRYKFGPKFFWISEILLKTTLTCANLGTRCTLSIWQQFQNNSWWRRWPELSWAPAIPRVVADIIFVFSDLISSPPPVKNLDRNLFEFKKISWSRRRHVPPWAPCVHRAFARHILDQRPQKTLRSKFG